MSTIASPRASITSLVHPASSPTNSTRSSLNLDRPKRTRDRAALRDYYNLKPSTSNTPTPSTSSNSTQPTSLASTATDPDDTTNNPLLAPLSNPSTFNSTDYISSLLQTASLAELLGVESALVGQVRGLDGERKALVYDNYSRLIAATAAIGKMRAEMEVQGEMRGVQEGVERVGVLVREAGGKNEGAVSGDVDENGEREVGANGDGFNEADGETQADAKDKEVQEQVQTVRYVLDTPSRLRAAAQEGRREEAEADWAEVKVLLEKWKNVKGVDEVREKAIAALNPA